MEYFNKIYAEMKQRYGVKKTTLIKDLPKILSPEDWAKLSQAMKYPRGVG